MLLLTPLAATPEASVPVLLADAQASAPMDPRTGTATVQLCPPMESAKLAVPKVEGVPDMVKVRFPEPLAKTPAARDAVRPVTPVDVTLRA